MAQQAELTRSLSLSSPAGEVYSIYRRTCYIFPLIPNSGIRNVVLTAGRWESLKSKRCWIFVHAAKCGKWVDNVTHIDEESKSITFTLLEGVVPRQLYDFLELEYQFVPDGEGCTAKVVLRYHSKDAAAIPNDYMDFIIKLLEAVDDFLQGTRC